MYLSQRIIYIYIYIYDRLHKYKWSCRFGLHKNWNNLQIFVLNLAICDLLYCSIPFPFYISLYLGDQWLFGEFWCKATAILAHIFAYTGWMALASIALVRVLAVTAPALLGQVCTNKGSKCIILCMWIFVVILLTPAFLEVIWHTRINMKFKTPSFLYVIFNNPYFRNH